MTTGALFCSCAGQIEEKISFEKVKKLLSKKVDWLEKVEFACSKENRKNLVEILKDRKPDALLILTCSPANKGNLFLEIAKEAGINPYMVNFVNIREQVAWVTTDSEEALKKLLRLTNGALSRLKRQTPLSELEFPINKDVLIVGGGVTGIKAALTLSKAGRKVFLVENTLSLGGKVSKFEKIFPDLSCAPCFLSPLIDEVLNSDAQIFLNSQLVELKGYFGNMTAKIEKKPTFINLRKCIGCSACEEACPEGAIKVESLTFPVVARINTVKCLRLKGEECALCIEACPVKDAIDFGERESLEILRVGSVLWAAGFSLLDCKKLPKLGYGKFKEIYDALEFENILNSEGITMGEIVTEEGEPPETIVILHCVGSLDQEYLTYCSKICCQYAFKFNRLIRETLPEAKIIHFVKEIVLPGEEAASLYWQVKSDRNVEFIRYEKISQLEVLEDDRLCINFRDYRIHCDMIVLCPAIVSNSTAFKDISGVFPVGSAREAMTIKEALTDALAYSGMILSELREDGIIKRDPRVAKIDQDRCSRCGICVGLCPYRAIEIEESKIKIIDSLCEGCGVCVAACPSKAIELKGFTDSQILAEITGILEAEPEKMI